MRLPCAAWRASSSYDSALPAISHLRLSCLANCDCVLLVVTSFELLSQEIPEQYKAIQSMRLLGRPVPFQIPTYLQNPPGPAPVTAPSGMMYPPPQAQAMGVPPPPAAAGMAARPPQPPAAAAGPGASPNAMFVCPITQDVMNDPVIAADGALHGFLTRMIDTLCVYVENGNLPPITMVRVCGTARSANKHFLRVALRLTALPCTVKCYCCVHWGHARRSPSIRTN